MQATLEPSSITTAVAASEQQARPGRVLIVDDVAANVRLLAGILKVEGFEVLSASSGEQALRFVRVAAPEAPDVILLDVMMPEMDGFEVCRLIKADPETAWLPVVMVTALQETSDRVQALEAGADDFLTKPVDEVEVVARVRSLVGIKRGRETLEKSYRDLRRAEAMRDSLSEMLVHDLRTPLTTMLMSMELLNSGQVGSLDSMQEELARMCLNGGRRLLDLINQLLDVAKMEGGEMPLQRELIDVPRLLDEAIRETSVIHRSDGARIESNLGGDLPPLWADEDLMRRVLVNLLGNAKKFSPDDKPICVRVRGVQDALLFEVADEGFGIAPEDQERIFDKFGQAESRQSGRKISTGLGLTFCKLAVEAHGGRIWCESALGQGSTFSFTLPHTNLPV